MENTYAAYLDAFVKTLSGKQIDDADLGFRTGDGSVKIYEPSDLAAAALGVADAREATMNREQQWKAVLSRSELEERVKRLIS